ncbi:uncharacterized protein [Pocillopora verrucosa]|uniref:uncharacterized protein n=1 Tax=Pocillopora verrucosa TaxID=203993 RepID=UPI003341CF06
MCPTEDKRVEQEQFVQSAVKKQQRNKRKREPDMFVAAVLECTVRRICSEVCSSYFCVCSSSKKKRKLSISRESNETDTTDLIPDGGDSTSEIQNNSLYELQEIITMSDKPQSSASEDSQLEEFLQSLTTELRNLPTFEDVNELLREIEGDSSHLDVLGDEIESLLNTSSDPFYPGLLEVLFP